MLFLVVYIGAIIVLFLFIVMMLNVKIIELNAKIIKYVPIGLFIILIFLFEVFYIINTSLTNTNTSLFLNENSVFLQLNLVEFYKIYLTFTNITSISQLLFTKYIYLFVIAGMILLVAMLGAILLTLNQNYINKRQDIVKQINTELQESNKLLKMKIKNNF
jgi:NADH-quinone oxidoreductase subunit J